MSLAAATLDPASVLLKYGFLIVLYLFLMWVARSQLRDLRRVPQRFGVAAGGVTDATSIHGGPNRTSLAGLDPRLVVERAPGHTPGMEYEIGKGAVLGRGDQAEIRLDDPFASSRHAQLVVQGGSVIIEDLNSTNGTYLNEELLGGPQPLHPGDRVRIGDSEFTYLEDV
jgi:hypothetical protein